MSRRDWFRITSARPMSLHEELAGSLPPRRVLVSCQYCGSTPYHSTEWYFEASAGVVRGVCVDCHENPPRLPDLGDIDLDVTEPVGPAPVR